jgi:phenylacetate-coenzyme A ligase PaaK-like adenylate-forming protein
LSPIQVFKTSGTTGEPLMIYLSAEELYYYAAGEAIMGLLTGGMRPNTIFQIHLPLDTSATAFLSTIAAQMAGALVLNQGWSGSAETHVKSIFKERNIPGKDKKVSVLFASPAYLWALTIKAEEMGMDFKQSGLKQIMTGGAMVTEQLKNRIRDSWGVELSEGFGMVETPAHAGFECTKGRIHFLDLTGYIEVLNPKTKEPSGYGEEGVLVKTEFYPDVEMMPFLRYWTQDLVIAGANKICPCGIPTSYVLDIVGRADQMVIVGAMNFYPQTIGDSLIGIPGLISPPRFHVSVTENDKGQIVILDVEGIGQLSGSDQEELRKIIAHRIAFTDSPALRKNAVEILINILPPKSIKEVFSYKHQGPDLSSLQQPFNDN